MSRIRRLALALAAALLLASLALLTSAGAAGTHARGHHARDVRVAVRVHRRLAARRHRRRHRRLAARRHGRVHRRLAARRHRRRHVRAALRRRHLRGHARARTRSTATLTAAACEGSALEPTQANLAEVRAATLCLVNAQRAAHHEQPLRASSDLAECALGHSESMASLGYFEHAGPDGSTPLQRMRASGYLSAGAQGYELAENIAWGSLGDSTPESIVAAWMASRGHRENILNSSFRDSGIGISPRLPGSWAGGEAGAIYTEDFGVIL